MTATPTSSTSSTPLPASVLLGVTGSIAAYKSVDLTSRLKKAGMDIHVVMTDSATKLVQCRTFFTISQNPVLHDLWETPRWEPEHIAVSEKTDILVIAPATANIIGKLANGIADDALSSCALSHPGPTLIAPAMNPQMWQNKAVQRNVARLKEDGVFFVGPAAGNVACGDQTAPGRMCEPVQILEAIRVVLTAATACRPMLEVPRKRLLITAGPTREAVDPVRFLSNPSTGKMGYALAMAASVLGHGTTLITGPTHLSAPANVHMVPVTSTQEMHDACLQHFPDADALCMTAAVSDYTPATYSPEKIKKELQQEVEPALRLTRTPDILTTLGEQKKPYQKILGFAAETYDLQSNAESKLRRKDLDWIAANDVSQKDIGFGSENNLITLIGRDECVELPLMTKTALAVHLLKHLLCD